MDWQLLIAGVIVAAALCRIVWRILHRKNRNGSCGCGCCSGCDGCDKPEKPADK